MYSMYVPMYSMYVPMYSMYVPMYSMYACKQKQNPEMDNKIELNWIELNSIELLGLRWMFMHLWMNLIKRTIDINNKKLWKSMYKVNGELSSCDITYSGRVPSREGDIHNFA